MNTPDVSRLVERAFRSGRDAGYKQALKEFQAELEARIQQTEDRAPELTIPASAPAPSGNDTVEHAQPAAELPPSLHHALKLVHDIPGITAWQASLQLNNNQSALYQLAKRGLVEKRGSQFYPLP